jgi:hypothetical protein
MSLSSDDKRKRKSPINVNAFNQTAPKRKVQFERVMEDAEICKLFKQFLEKAQCVDAMLFLEAVKQFENSSEDRMSQRRSTAINIYKTFVERDSIQEINIASTIVSPIDQYFKSINGSGGEINSDIFSDAKLSITKQLKEHSYPLFKKSEEFRQHMREKSVQYIEQLVPKSPTSVQRHISPFFSAKYVFDPSLRASITDRDILFSMKERERIQNDYVDHFHYLSNEKDHCCMISNKGVDLGSPLTNNMMLVTYSGILPYSCENVIHTVLDTTLLEKKKVITKYVKQYTNDPLKNESYSVVISYKRVKYGVAGLSKRDFVLASTCVYDPHRSMYIIVSKSCVQRNVKEQKGWKRAVQLSYITLHKRDNGTTHYSYSIYLNVSKWTTRTLMKIYYKSTSSALHNDLMNRLKENEKRGFPEPDMNTLGIWPTLLDYRTYHQETAIGTKECSWDALQRILINNTTV